MHVLGDDIGFSMFFERELFHVHFPVFPHTNSIFIPAMAVDSLFSSCLCLRLFL